MNNAKNSIISGILFGTISSLFLIVIANNLKIGILIGILTGLFFGVFKYLIFKYVISETVGKKINHFLKIILYLIIGTIIFLIGLSIYEEQKEKRGKEFCSCDKEVKSNPIKYKGIEIAESYGRGFLVGQTLKLYNDSCFHYMTWGDIHPTIGRTGKYKIIENEIQFSVNCYYENYGWPKEPYGWEILEIEDERRKMSNRSICINNGEVYFGCRNPIENKDDNEYFEKNEDYFLTIYKPKKEK